MSKGKGVLKENHGITQHVNVSQPPYYVNNIKYYPEGVRKRNSFQNDSTSYRLSCIKHTHRYRPSKSDTRPKSLYVNRPCICGSKYHSRTTHLMCPCNPRYDDAIES